MKHPFEIRIPATQMGPLRIISVALAVGATLLVGVFVAIAFSQNQNFSTELDLLEIFVLVQAVTLIPASYVVPKLIARSTIQQQFASVDLENEISNDAIRPANERTVIARLLGIRQTMTIIGCALLEGVALFGAVVFFLNQSIYPLIVAGICCLLLFTRIETESKIQNWIYSLVQDPANPSHHQS